ncbi:hypothetical protein PAAG_07842 [Paracoccidioides lutzii Pb01]|uniref:Uncharacterized protein n=1 Tax=Paracoccidioides lutzii (strain ATCC MYA-826 / Pb01) TaxID=502779 RepID=C1HAX8_PARBA|nr:hypothetical protein PAAG_07842 [Paracoccidioides lutzii Pb01]EEH37424.2 hypothetical protein PAAG_07842 [Paracoccidioides lutzii Pb01]
MADSPAVSVPLDPREQPILDQLLVIRDALLLLKQDKSRYIKSQDVLYYHDQVVEQVQKLNSIRSDNQLQHNRGSPHPHIPTFGPCTGAVCLICAHVAVDNVLDDCFQLISLLFLTVGRNNEAPAAYAMASTIKRLLDHLKEAAFFSQKDLDSISKTLDTMQGNIDRGKDTYSTDLLKLLGVRLETCRKLLGELQQDLSFLSPELVPIHEVLVSILRSTSAANTRSKFSYSEVLTFQEQLKGMKASMKDGNFLGPGGSIPAGQGIVKVLLERCLKWVEIVLERQGRIDERFKEPYDKLLEIRNQLDRLAMTQAWSLRETDLFMYQRKLNMFDESRVDGNFLDKDGKPADIHAQRTLLYLIRRSYALIYGLLISSEPVSEALLPIYNQLQTLRKCLLEVKDSGGVSNSRELYPYSMKLNSIDNMRIDGKFYVGNDLPEGQGSVNELLAQCYDLCYELRAQSEEIAES